MSYKTILMLIISTTWMTAHASESDISSRYGKFQIKESQTYPQGALYFNQKLVTPVIEGNNGLSIENIYKLQKDDVALVEEIGGSGCPVTLYFVKVTPTKQLTVSPAFGSCSDLIKVSAQTNQIVITMPDFMGAPESEEQERQVAKHKMTYIYDGNVVKENGKILKRSE